MKPHTTRLRHCLGFNFGRLSALLLLLFAGWSTSLFGQTTTAGSVTSATTQTESGKQKAVFGLSTGGVCEIIPYAPDVIRVKFDWGGIESHEDVAIAKPLGDWPAFTATFTDGSIYTIETDELIVEVTKSPNIKIDFVDKTQSGQYLLRDKRMEYDTGYNPYGDTTFQLLKNSNDIAAWYRVRVVKESPANESYFGLGEVPFQLNRRGQVVQGWNSDSFYWNDQKNPMYMTMPFMYGVQTPNGSHSGFTYGVFWNNPARPNFMFQRERPYGGAQRNQLTTVNDQFSFEATEGYIDYFFFGGGDDHTPAAVLSRYSELTGMPALPPRWGLGHHLSRWTYTEDQMRNIVATARSQGYPLDAIYFDIDYMDSDPHIVPPGGTFQDDEYRGNNDMRQLTFQDDPNNSNYWFKDGVSLISYLHTNNVKAVPLIEAWFATADPLWTEANNNSHLISNNNGSTSINWLFFGDVSYLDFTSSAAQSWWKTKQKNYLSTYAFDGIWNDLNEQADERDTVAQSQPIPLDGLYDADGRYGSSTSDYRRQQIYLKNTYNVYQASNTYDTLAEQYPNTRPFVLSRAGWPGIQRYAFNWSGDNVNESAGGAYGQGPSLRVGLSTMISGQVYFGHDLGGFLGNVSSESMTRWAQWCSLMPFFRNHSGKWDQLREPWLYANSAEIKAALELRSAIMPYFYSLAYRASTTGLPLNNPLFFSFPNDAQTHQASSDYDFMVGPYLLASPVTQTGATQRSTYLPSGTNWYYWHDDSFHSGGSSVTKSTPISVMPMYVAEGGIIPMRPVLQYANEFQPEELTIHAWPSEDETTFTLYDDDGETFDYESGEYALTELTNQTTSGLWTFTIGAKQGTYDHGHDYYMVVRHAIDAPTSVEINSVAASSFGSLGALQAASSGYFYDSNERCLYVRTDETSQAVTITAGDNSANQITLYYITDFANLIHYDAGIDGSWTTFPGEALSSSIYPGVKSFTINDTSAEFAFTDDGTNWDNNGGGNYTINAAGTYTVDPVSGTIVSGAPQEFTIHYLPPVGWTSALMHYSANGGDWTAFPGTSMGVSSADSDYFELTVYGNELTQIAFTDDGTNWENNGGSNYTITTPGTYTIDSTDNSIVSGPPGGIQLFYETTWTNAFIHYNADSSGWTTAPGDQMQATAMSNFKYIEIDADTLEFAFNDGAGTWDSNNGNNYSITQPGLYTVGFGGNLLPNYNPIRIEIYYDSAFSPQTHMHYNVDGLGWTTIPGDLMDEDPAFPGYEHIIIEGTSIEVAFTDDGTNWDNNGGSNYTIANPGVYSIDSSTNSVTSGYPAVTIYYSTPWTNANIHYNADSSGWTTSPGVAMSNSSVSGYKVVTIDATNVEFAFNDNNGTWDSNGGNNYNITGKGIYTVENGTVSTGAP
ncbi:TIM-barrel domain-containing protein [Cerasicoccus fimbriatus]|uniref:TIM-barrel domain-containing protein n=1 Tax=Cerasicoccus fimbriatus TaxID=3014554 RepID=UPI0022B4D8B2|nr:TIM-barrel domain-containing protein [Cerasicoccus sp. TK19100]